MPFGIGVRRRLTLGLTVGLMIAVLSVGTLPRAAAARFNRKVDIGQPAPQWKGLEGVDGAKHSLDDYKAAKILIVAFTCNQCPISQLYEDRFIRFAKEHKRDVAFVAISCSLLAPDRLEKMKERAKKKGFNFDYVADPSQQTGKDYGATVTPQVFVLDQDRHIAYMGKFDDNIEPDKVQREFVEDAVRSLLSGKRPEPAETFATG